MPDTADSPPIAPQPTRTCPSCQHEIPADATYCPECAYPINVSEQPANATTSHLKRDRLTVPSYTREAGELPEDGAVILQLLPSGTCITLSLKNPMVLGRNAPDDDHGILDLAGFNALRHGVSRKHCKLQRRGMQVYVTDIGSANGTYLNHAPLIPHREYAISHGDQLVIGSLHMFIAFSAPED